VQFWALDDGRKTRLKHVDHLTGIHKLRKVTSCWLYSAKSRSLRRDLNPGPFEYDASVILAYYVRNETTIDTFQNLSLYSPLKMKINPNYTYRFGLHRAVNTLSLGYKNQLHNHLQTESRCLF
jgi:hypothetical protein